MSDERIVSGMSGGDGQRRRALLDEFYDRLADVARRTDQPRLMSTTTGWDPWPKAGVYFFLEPGEVRDDGHTPRVVRVGTHALAAGSKTTLWTRIRTHRGTLGGRNPGSGNHRRSVFRRHVGTALLGRGGFESAADTWDRGKHPPRETRDKERELERAVSKVIGAMSIAVVEVKDRHDRARLERASIGLLSTSMLDDPSDQPSGGWLGHSATRPAISEAGLWNVNHVTESIEEFPTVLHLLDDDAVRQH